ncbi:hypothetical protein EX30DRAFT_339446 [Ascodesmis nigricans]|uniref:Uncharacterized protein n=1 Tax=Ascodesmis nigricans TaxID=341454 RepID=A0A4S2N2T7_9PEZI|nr:hypothetical protein EX30DRAFT_339446 [Ascodesmis nigricans]
MNTSPNHDKTHVRGGASIHKTPANTTEDPDSKTSTGVLSGLFSGSKGDKEAPAKASSSSNGRFDFRTHLPGQEPDNGPNSIKATLGRMKNEIMGTNPGDKMGEDIGK